MFAGILICLSLLDFESVSLVTYCFVYFFILLIYKLILWPKSSCMCGHANIFHLWVKCQLSWIVQITWIYDIHWLTFGYMEYTQRSWKVWHIYCNILYYFCKETTTILENYVTISWNIDINIHLHHKDKVYVIMKIKIQ
jgi:hypothetical protein